MKCKKCGYELREGSKFCPKCGTPVDAAPKAEEKAVSNGVTVDSGLVFTDDSGTKQETASADMVTKIEKAKSKGPIDSGLVFTDDSGEKLSTVTDKVQTDKKYGYKEDAQPTPVQSNNSQVNAQSKAPVQNGNAQQARSYQQNQYQGQPSGYQNQQYQGQPNGNYQQPYQNNYQQTQPHQKPKSPKKPMSKKTKIVIGVAVVAVVAVCCVFGYVAGRGKTISVSEGLTPKFTGGDGYGSVAIKTSVPTAKGNKEEKEFEDELESISNSIMSSGNYSQSLKKSKKFDAMTNLKGSIKCEWQDENGKEIKQGTLKNGEKIVYACKYNESYAKDAGYRYKDLETTYTVKGLKKVKEFNPFDNVTVDWSTGASTWGATIEPEFKIKDGSIQKKLADEGILTYMFDDGDSDSTDVGNYTADNVRVQLHANFDSDKLIKKGYVDKNAETVDGAMTDSSKQDTKIYEIGAKPVIIKNTSDAKALEAAQKVTDPLIKKDIETCGNTLSQTDYDADTDDKALTIAENGYSVKGLDSNYGDSMNVVYNVNAGGVTFTRKYPVTVYKKSDGTYAAASDKDDSDTVSCQVYVSEYEDEHDWN